MSVNSIQVTANVSKLLSDRFANLLGTQLSIRRYRKLILSRFPAVGSRLLRSPDVRVVQHVDGIADISGCAARIHEQSAGVGRFLLRLTRAYLAVLFTAACTVLVVVGMV